jgi:hypothetical protein
MGLRCFHVCEQNIVIMMSICYAYALCVFLTKLIKYSQNGWKYSFHVKKYLKGDYSWHCGGGGDLKYSSANLNFYIAVI